MKYSKYIIVIVLFLLFAGCTARGGNAVIGTPAAPDTVEGVLFFPASVKGVRVQTNAIEVLSGDQYGRPGFAYVVLETTFVNESEHPIIPPGTTLVDGFSNVYINQEPGTIPFVDQLQAMPLTIASGEISTGEQVFLVPTTALQSDLRLRWESLLHNARIDIFLGALSITQ